MVETEPHNAVRQRLALLTRAPQPGKVKSRLVPRLGPEAAAELQAAFIRDLTQRLGNHPDWELIVYLQGDADAVSCIEPGTPVRPQARGDLGQRMLAVLEQAQAEHITRTVIVGSDSPDLPSERVSAAFSELSRCDVVLVPAFDGGFVLIAAAEPPRGVLQDQRWGASGVLAATLERISDAGLRARLLEPWYDVDRPEDAAFLKVHLDSLFRAHGEDRAPHSRRELQRLAAELLS